MNVDASPMKKKPSSVEEFMQCLIWPGWDPFVAFDDGSKHCLNLKPALIRESINSLRKRSDLSRYTLALTRIVRLSLPDDVLKIEWQSNLKQLRALMSTSASGTNRQRARLVEIAGNARLVAAMRFALKHEKVVETNRIEPTWIAVLYAEGSEASVREADRFNAHLDGDTQCALRTYLGEAKSHNQG